ncbi:sugar ABC transporter permease [Planomonospora parontospora subsp. parontospora]|uniref:Sugar ABC transporter permease n=2 Tax=Planomonospora parontospora TaxID=58119 RepID=A0AA37BHJ6_9ACTN|nr:sugar ABC transporter permease [Planomonospora parontospora]GGK72409.1 sugar ABC transporter permease [Planomonospora parontospora]GGL22156.1 sugar ABC transporter permease [Planomonospora parontospora subsp. antibiotica]GII09282.1 sugar ABC transporter permease [Planomonospora parontospora subsp. parontospora]GII15702.1 sugar ABC transporter permease [Planomonospora parontospora subsp. antibiotica]
MTNTSTIARGGGASPAPGRRRQSSQRPAKASGLPAWVVPYVLLVPGLLVIAALLLYPLFQMVVMSFQKVGLRQIRGVPAEWVGWDNYTQIFDNEIFWSSLRNTVGFAVVTVSLTLILGTAVGTLLNRLSKRMSTFVVVGIMSAWAVPPVAQGVIWRWLFDADAGMINWGLNLLPDWFSRLLFGRADWTGEPWLNDALSTYLVLIITVVWASFPFIAVSVLAGLKGIPAELYEAARVDGSSAWRTFRKITFPLLKPVFAVLTILSIIWNFKVFSQLYVLMNGPTNREAFNLSMFSFAEAFRSPPKMGTGAAIAVVLTLLLLVVTSLYVRQIVKTEEM